MDKFKCIKTVDSDFLKHRVHFKEGAIYNRSEYDNPKRNKELTLVSELKEEFIVAKHWVHYKLDRFFREHFEIIND